MTVSYTSPGSDNGSLRDNSGNEVANFAGQPVDNKTPPLGAVHLTAYPDVCRPPGAECPGAPVGYVAPGPEHGQITMTWEPATFSAAVGSWRYRHKKTSESSWPSWQNLSSATQRSHTLSNLDVTETYDFQIRGIGSRIGGEGDIGEAVRVRPADNVPPAFSSAAVTGTTLTVTFDEGLDTGSTPAGSAFSVSATPTGGTTRNIAGTGTATVAGKTATVTLAEAVIPLETVKVSYSAPDTGPLRDNSGNEVANFAGQPVFNITLPPGGARLTAYPDACVPSGAACPDAPVGYVAPGPSHAQITMTWEPATTGAAATSWRFRYKKTSEGWPSWQNLSSATQRSHTLSNLDLSQTYDFQIRGMGANDGEGDIGEAVRGKASG